MDWQAVWDECIDPDFYEFCGRELFTKRYDATMLGWAKWMFAVKHDVKLINEATGINKWIYKWGNLALEYSVDMRLCFNYDMLDNSKLVRRIRDYVLEIPRDIETQCPEFRWKKWSKYSQEPQRHRLYLGDFTFDFPSQKRYKHVAWFLLERIPEVVST